MPKHTTPEQVTDILREFLDSGQDMTEFAKNKKMERNTLANWVKGIKVPGGRQGLTDEERGKLDERVRKTDPQKVTELLREFLGSGQNMTEFAKNKEMGRTTFFEWVKGIKVAGGRQGLTDEERGKLDERVRKTDPQKVTEVLREFLESNLIGSEFARSKKIGPSVFYNWVKGVKVPDGRAGLTPAERELLDGRFQENRWDKEGPQKVTRILREFLESDLSGSEFARNKKIERSVFYRWVGGKRVPGGRAGLTPAERGLLDGRLRENRWNQADPQNVTQTLREFLDSDLNMAEFSKIKDISPTTFYNWVSGKKVAGGRAGLTQAEQERLDERRRG
ncbi:hypothetical protein ACWD5R_45220, partial [Streptomyces sp. NPDC002514]|uniref:hypothetical protein n=1 Tax=Streptomyces sp. NPDC001270 TaxID=3364554 RepID=UPI003674A122